MPFQGGCRLMSKSLQDQLLSLGLARKKSGPEKKGAGQKKHSANARGRNSSKDPVKGAGNRARESGAEMSLDQAYALRKKEEKQAELDLFAVDWGGGPIDFHLGEIANESTGPMTVR